MPRAPTPDSVESRIARVIQRSAPGSVFTPSTFAALGSREAIDKGLQRLASKCVLRRLSRGLYDKPRHDALFGELWPSVDAVVKAVIGKDKTRVQPSGVYAANLLGLSEQVPAKVVLLTDGRSRTLQAGPMRIEFRRTTPRNMAAAGRLSGLVIQAFKSLGPDNVTPERIEHLRRTIPAAEREKLKADLNLAPVWMQPHLGNLARDTPAVADETHSSKATP